SLASGASVTYTLTAQISPSATGSLVNTVTVTSANDTNSANNSASDTDTLTPRADLQIAKTVSNATPNVGDTIGFTITLSNLGPSLATNVEVTDLLPSGLAFISAVPSQGTYVSATGVWTVGTVSTPAPQTLQLQARVVSSAAQTNVASVKRSDQ